MQKGLSYIYHNDVIGMYIFLILLRCWTRTVMMWCNSVGVGSDFESWLVGYCDGETSKLFKIYLVVYLSTIEFRSYFVFCHWLYRSCPELRVYSINNNTGSYFVVAILLSPMYYRRFWNRTYKPGKVMCPVWHDDVFEIDWSCYQLSRIWTIHKWELRLWSHHFLLPYAHA